MLSKQRQKIYLQNVTDDKNSQKKNEESRTDEENQDIEARCVQIILGSAK